MNELENKMPYSDDEIQNRLDAGDRGGAVRLAARAKIAEVKAQREAALTKAMEAFVNAHPEFEHGAWKFYTGLMKKWLIENGVDPANASFQDLESAWAGIKGKRIRSTVPARQEERPQALLPQTPVEDQATVEAKRWIAEGRISRESIDQMSNNQFELASRSATFSRCVELLFPRLEPSLLTRGELALASGQANVEASRGNIDASAAAKIEEMNRWKREHIASISTATGVPSGVRASIVNTNLDIPIRKLATQAQLDAAVRQEREDARFFEEQRAQAGRRLRVQANRKRG